MAEVAADRDRVYVGGGPRSELEDASTNLMYSLGELPWRRESDPPLLWFREALEPRGPMAIPLPEPGSTGKEVDALVTHRRRPVGRPFGAQVTSICEIVPAIRRKRELR